MKQRIASITIALICMSLLYAAPARAIDPFAIYTNNSVSVSITPEFPQSGESVTVSLTSYGADLQRASITWTMDGKTLKSGIGATEVTITAPTTGTTKTVLVKALLSSGAIVEKSIPISPQDVDILIESIDGYVPPFYKGRSLPIREGLVKVSAIPHINGVVDSKEAVYNWNQNTKPLPEFSGYGKRYFVYKNAFLNSFDTIRVTASSRLGTSAAQEQKTINLYTPKVLFYQDHPSQGLLTNEALTDRFTMGERETTFIAIPYFATPTTYNNPLSANLIYTWKINGSETTPTEKNRITLRRPEGSSGTAKLNVSVKNSQSSFQKTADTETIIGF